MVQVVIDLDHNIPAVVAWLAATVGVAQNRLAAGVEIDLPVRVSVVGNLCYILTIWHDIFHSWYKLTLALVLYVWYSIWCSRGDIYEVI